MTVLNQIQQAASLGELASVVIHYLYEIGETEEAHGETYKLGMDMAQFG